TLTVQSLLTSGARSAPVLDVTQANDNTNNSTAPLVRITQSDTATTAAALQLGSDNNSPALVVDATGDLVIDDFFGSAFITKNLFPRNTGGTGLVYDTSAAASYISFVGGTMTLATVKSGTAGNNAADADIRYGLRVFESGAVG